QKFTAEVICELLTIWPDVYIINDCPKHPKSQELAHAMPLCCYKLPKNWFKASELQDNFNQQEIVELLLGAAALNIEGLDEEIMYKKLDEIRDEMIDKEFDKRFEELDETFNNMMKEILENRASKWLPEESALVELSENETFSKSLLENDCESLLENNHESLLESDYKSLLESELEIHPSKRHKTSVLTAFTLNTNIQHMKFIEASLQSLLNNNAII
ncbi:8340_t:CDS:2, partial [Cetraspora pellucida]